jgi:hypothetical protein
MHPPESDFSQKGVHKIIIQGQIKSQTERKIDVSEVCTQVKLERQGPEKSSQSGLFAYRYKETTSKMRWFLCINDC